MRVGVFLLLWCRTYDLGGVVKAGAVSRGGGKYEVEVHYPHMCGFPNCWYKALELVQLLSFLSFFFFSCHVALGDIDNLFRFRLSFFLSCNSEPNLGFG